LTLTDGLLRMSQSSDVSSVQAGNPVNFTLNPSVTRPTSATNAVGNVTLTDTLPACMRYVPGTARYTSGSAPLGIQVTAANNGVDGVPCTGDSGETPQVLTLNLGSIVPGTTIPALTFQVTALRMAVDNTAAVNTAVIGSDAAVAVDLTMRTTTSTVTIRNQSAFSFSESTATPQISTGDKVNFTLSYRNVSGAAVPAAVFLTELPYNGDGSSSFAGTLVYTSIAAPAGATVLCTSAAHGTITGSTAYTSTCDSTTTALKISLANIASGAADDIQITLTASGNANGDKYVDSSTGTYTPNGSTTPVALPATEAARVDVVSSTISGQVWTDTDGDGVRESGENPVSGFAVALSGTNDLGTAVTASTSTNSSGAYSFAGLRAGTYTVTFAPSSLLGGQRFSPQSQGDDRSIDSDGDATTGATGRLVLAVGATLANIDQGVVPAAGLLSITTPGSANLGTVAAGTDSLSGQLGVTTVADTRVLGGGSWTAYVSMTDFTSGAGASKVTIPAGDATYSSGAGTGVGLGTFTQQPGAELGEQQMAAKYTSGVAVAAITWNPTLLVDLPDATVAGTYTATVTTSVV